jgi:hypothetical protein
MGAVLGYCSKRRIQRSSVKGISYFVHFERAFSHGLMSVTCLLRYQPPFPVSTNLQNESKIMTFELPCAPPPSQSETCPNHPELSRPRMVPPLPWKLPWTLSVKDFRLPACDVELIVRFRVCRSVFSASLSSARSSRITRAPPCSLSWRTCSCDASTCLAALSD